MLILAIETSCDETAAAIVEGVSPADAKAMAGKPTLPVKVLSNVVASSEEMHKKTGGIVPEVAAREQLRSMIPVIREAILEAAQISNDKFLISNQTPNPNDKINKWAIENLHAIAVTVGPGLIGSLLVGVETAKALAYAWNKPIVGVNHLIAHLYANWVTQKSKIPSTKLRASRNQKSVPEFPAVGLVVSGGHTDLVLMRGHPTSHPPSSKTTDGHGKASRGKVEIEWLGGTRDDAAGECFDKGARLLGFPYPGGPAVAKLATELDNDTIKQLPIKLPRPLINDETYDFSFSGLKTALLREVQKVQKALAYELQEAIVDVLVAKVMRAVEEFRPRSVLLGGGVAANLRLREKLILAMKQRSNVATHLFIPSAELCTDNAVPIGATALLSQLADQGKLGDSIKARSIYSWENIKVDPGLEIV